MREFASPMAGVLAFGATWFAPPLLLDGPFWGQTESWVLAPAVWMLIAMVRRAWLVAGICWGLALALKPSGLLFGPVWLYAFLFRAPRDRRCSPEASPRSWSSTWSRFPSGWIRA